VPQAQVVADRSRPTHASRTRRLFCLYLCLGLS
jgi:hypothetical protein